MKKRQHKNKPRPRANVVVGLMDVSTRVVPVPVAEPPLFPRPKEKFYQSKGMLRAGRPVRVLRGDYSLLLVKNGEAKVMAHTDTMAVTRDGYGWPKAFAEMFARDPHMRVYQCSLWDAYRLAADIQQQLKPRNIFSGQSSVYTVPIDAALPAHPAEKRKWSEDWED